MPAVSVQRIRVQADRIIFDVRFSHETPRHTDRQIAQQALACRPRVVRHTCINSKGAVFGDVVGHTPLPHLLEHLAIDLAVEHLAASQGIASGKSRTITGMSEWINRNQGTARVTLSCPDDLLVLQSFNEAVEILNNMVVG